MTELIFNQSFFAEHFDKFFDEFSSNDAHPESFFQNFYWDFIGDDYLTDEQKQSWIDSWTEDYEDEVEGKSFSEILDENEHLIEDVAHDLILEDESIKAKAIPQLFIHISEMWDEDCIQSFIDEIKEAN